MRTRGSSKQTAQLNLVRAGLIAGCLLATLLVVSGSQAQVVLNEVMFDPSGSEYYDEFVELLNVGKDTVNLAGWRIGDDSELDSIVSAGEGLDLLPGQFALVLDPGYVGHSTSYDSLIPAAALVVTIDDGAFGKGGFSNSTPETVVLVDADGDTVGAYRYSLDNPPGFSDEKIDPGGGDEPSNWANSRVFLGTPGFANSVARKDVDAALSFVGPDTLLLPNPREIGLRVAVRNVGRLAIAGATVQFWWDRDADGIPDEPEEAGQSSLAALPARDSALVQFTWSPPGRGLFLLRARVNASGDQSGDNDLDSLFVLVTCPARQVVINEIYYRPAAGEPEWVEVYNVGPDAISLAGWWLSDGTRRGTVQLGLGAARRLLPPGGYAVLAENGEFAGFAGLPRGSVLQPAGGFPSLNNTGDVVVLRDALGTRMDSLRYRASWGGENGVSLERVRPLGASTDRDNWRSCVAPGGSTPGHRNSVAPPDRAVQVVLELEPRECSPRGGPISIWARVANVGLDTVRSGELRLDAQATGPCGPREVALGDFAMPTLAPLDSFEVSVSWIPRSVGRWLIRGQVVPDEQGTEADTARAAVWVSPAPRDVVVNEIQFDPPAGEPEWVEVYNRGGDSISLDGWWLSDSHRRVLLDSIGRCLEPDEYAVILPAGVPPPFGTPPGTLVWHVRGTWPGLSNAGDAVALVDPCGLAIDSLSYRPSWRRGPGSLERIFPDAPSTDSTNWAACTDPAGATPGRLNAVTPREVDLAVTGIRWHGCRVASACSVVVEVANVGLTGVSGAAVRLHLLSRGERSVGVAQVPTLSPGDTLEIPVEVTFDRPGWVSLVAAVFCKADAHAENDSVVVRVYVSPTFGSVALNELYVTPLAGQVEWLEIVNTTQWDLSLHGWSVEDDRGRAGAGALRDSLVLPAGGTAVLAADSSVLSSWSLPADAVFLVPTHWPGFNDDGDVVRLEDPGGLVADSLRYGGDWGVERGYSLEKLRPELPSPARSSWTRSTDPAGGTPGAANSVFAYTMPTRAALSVQPNPFSPDGDGHEDVAVFSLSFPGAVATVRLRIFDVAGRRVRELLANEPCGPHRLVVWDGRDDQGRLCRVGPYIALLEWRTADGRSGTKRTVVVVAW